MFTFKDITVSYQQDNPVVEQFNLTIKKGEIVGIVGESGSGKTTIAQAAMGLLPSQGRVERGELYFLDEPLLSYSQQQWRKIRGKELAMIFQDTKAMLNPIRKIGSQYAEYIRVYKKTTKKEAEKMCYHMLSQMMLPDVKQVLNSYPFELSGGMLQRVGIAMAMTFQPKLLLADEPTSALDVTTQAQIVKLMMDQREKFQTSILLVTHNIGMASYIADRLVVMQKGKVVDMGTPEQLLNHPMSEYTKNLLACVPTLEGKSYV